MSRHTFGPLESHARVGFTRTSGDVRASRTKRGKRRRRRRTGGRSR